MRLEIEMIIDLGDPLADRPTATEILVLLLFLFQHEPETRSAFLLDKPGGTFALGGTKVAAVTTGDEEDNRDRDQWRGEKNS